MRKMTRSGDWLRRFVRDESGQDLVEYALLAAIIGLTSLLAYTTIPAKMATFFSNRETAIYDLWEPPAPIPPTP